MWYVSVPKNRCNFFERCDFLFLLQFRHLCKKDSVITHCDYVHNQLLINYTKHPIFHFYSTLLLFLCLSLNMHKKDMFTMTDNDLGRLAASLEALPLRLPWDSCVPKKVRGWQDKIKSAMTTTQLITFLKTLTNNLFLVCWAFGHIIFDSNHSEVEFHKVLGVEMLFSLKFLQTEWDLDKNLSLSCHKIYF